MKQAILIRVIPENFNQWRTSHDECRQARLEYGMTDGPVYRDENNPDIVMVHLDVEDMERAKGWFKDDRFREGMQRAGNVSREIWMSSQK